MWLPIRAGRFEFRIQLLVPVAAAAFALLLPRSDLWLRYLLILSVLVFHECAHAVTALLLGARRAIVCIWVCFGLAYVDRFGDRREAWVALAGPAANLVAAAALALAGGRPTLALGSAPILDLLLAANLLMGAGNLIPVFPIDGGRALRALRRRPDAA